MLGFGPLATIPVGGSPMTASVVYSFLLDTGEFAIDGFDAALTVSRVMALGTGEFTIDGFDAVAARNRFIFAETGSYIITGYDARIYRSSFSGDAETIRVTPEVTSMRVPYEPREMSAGAKPGGEIVYEEHDGALEPRLRRI